MPTNAYANHRFATMSAAQVIEEQQRMQERWAAEDAERRARNAARLAAL